MLDLEQLIQGFVTAERTALTALSSITVIPVQKSLARRADIAHLVITELERQAEVHPNSGALELDPDAIATIVLDAVETICR